ncbi:hypothetical protein L7F22_007275 [Adiantum nelumboides]|nr:hypothetical protein [Adiantum nelumboides]
MKPPVCCRLQRGGNPGGQAAPAAEAKLARSTKSRKRARHSSPSPPPSNSPTRKQTKTVFTLSSKACTPIAKKQSKVADAVTPNIEADVHQNEGANLPLDKLKGQLKNAKVALLKAKDSVDVVYAMHVEELKNTVCKLSLTIQTLQVVVEEKAPLDAMVSALKEINFTQEVEECAQARMEFGRSMQVKRKAEPNTEVDIVGGYNCGEQDLKVEVHAEKEGVLAKDSHENGDQAKNCPSSVKDKYQSFHLVDHTNDVKGKKEKDDKYGAARKPTKDAEGQTKTSKDQVEKEIGENSNMESGRKGGDASCAAGAIGASCAGEDTEIIIEKSKPPQKNGDAFVDAGVDASCASGAGEAGGAGEDTEIIIEKSEPPKENGDASMDVSGDASCVGGAVGAGEDMEIITEKSEPPQENGDAFVDASGDASCVGGAVGASEDMNIIIENFEPP